MRRALMVLPLCVLGLISPSMTFSSDAPAPLHGEEAERGAADAAGPVKDNGSVKNQDAGRDASGQPSLGELTAIYGSTWLNAPPMTRDVGASLGEDADGAADDGEGDLAPDDSDENDPAPGEDVNGDEEAAPGVAQLPDVPIVINRQVEAYIKYFQTRGRKHFERWLARRQHYLEMVTEILREDGLPEDLFYIAFIESGLRPDARSRAKAVGMWQFIKGTAKKYGLRVDWWIDERRDPEKSTRAASRYFKNLYERFGSWYLAAAGYNAGEGRITKAIKRHNSDDFWVISTAPPRKKGMRRVKGLKKETRDYVPKYIAAMLIAKEPEKYGFEVTHDEEALSYEKVKVTSVTDLRVAAEAAGVSVEDLKRLNPELLHWFTPPNYPDYELKLPAGSAARYAENIAKIPPPQRIRFLEHRVRRGESLSRIARTYGTSVKPILYLNNLKSVRFLRPGTIVLVPVRAADNNKKGKRVADAVEVNWGLHG